MCVGDVMQIKWLLFCVFVSMCVQDEGTCDDRAAYLNLRNPLPVREGLTDTEPHECMHVCVEVVICVSLYK